MDDAIFVERVLGKLDTIETKLIDLCIRMAAAETSHSNHMQSIRDEADRKLRRRDYTMVLIGVGIGIVELLRSIGVI